MTQIIDNQESISITVEQIAQKMVLQEKRINALEKTILDHCTDHLNHKKR